MSDAQTILVIFGITGDLAQRKLLPALRSIAQAGLLPPTKIIGISRRAVDSHELLRQTFGETYDDTVAGLAANLSIFTMDLAEPAGYERLATHLATERAHLGADTQVLFYLSVPPQATLQIVEHLGAAQLNDAATKLLLEKPFGVDLPSAEEAVATIGQFFSEEQLYRIDHYLAKEMAQNILAFRSRNTLFRNLWRAEFIERIDIIASEQIGIEGRAQFYEQTGALRDFLQNHLMQLLALTIMDIPADMQDSDVPLQRVAALEALQPVDVRQVQRGQYAGYSTEVANPGSTTETYAAITFQSAAPQWQDVPFRLATGKHLAERTTEIRIYFKKAHDAEANQLTLHLQPKEGIEIALWAKKPGYQKTYEPVDLRFDYRQQQGKPVEAYERVLLDAMASDKSLFTTTAEVIASWRLLQPVQEYWAMRADDLVVYDAGISIEEITHGNSHLSQD